MASRGATQPTASVVYLLKKGTPSLLQNRVWNTQNSAMLGKLRKEKKFHILIVVFPCMLIITQLLFQQNALVFYY
jgi:hypothetical protein